MRHWFAASLFVVSVAHGASAQTGSISGTVTASADASPIAFANVDLYRSDHLSFRTVLTDGTGAYVLPNLAAGTYYVRFVANGFVPTAYSGIPCIGNACVIFDFPGYRLGITPTPVTVTDNTATIANASLDRGGTISGTVKRAADGTAISGIGLYLADGSTTQVALTSTDSTGKYSFNQLPFDTYYVVTESDTFVDYLDQVFGGGLCRHTTTQPLCRIESGTPIVVNSGSPAATADFNLPPAGKISGIVYDGQRGSSFRLSRWPVTVYAGSTLVDNRLTDPGGAYSFAGLDPGTYFIRTAGASTGQYADLWYQNVCVACPGTHPTPITLASGTGVSVDFPLPPAGGGISGTLTLQGVTQNVFVPAVQIYNAAGALVKTSPSFTIPNTPPPTNTFTWSVSGLPDGTYYVKTFNQAMAQDFVHGPLPTGGYWIDQLYGGKVCIAADCLPTSGTPVIVSGGAATTGVNFTLDFGATFSGTASILLGQTDVQLFDSRGVLLPGRAAVSFAGKTLAAGLPAGTYYALLRNPGFGARRILFNNIPCAGCAVTAGTPIILAAGEQETGFDFSAINGQTISGTVRADATTSTPNQPLGSITVEAYAGNGELIAASASFADGTYRVEQLPPGTYYLRTRNSRGYIDQVYTGQTCGACDPVAGTAVVVPSGSDVSGIDFALPYGQAISGQVIASGGGPLSSAVVLVYASSPSSPAAHVTTDTLGAYSATVPAGSYFLQTDPVSGYTQQIYDGIACPQGSCPAGSGTQVAVSSTPVTNVNFNLPACTAPAIAPLSLANAAAGASYRQTLLATGASGAVSWLVSSGSMPPGLSLDPGTGVISGTPTTAGQFTFTVSAVDSLACAGSRTYTLDVPPCPFTLFTPSASLRARGEPWLILLGNTCGTVTATSNASWITVQTVTSTAVGVVAAPNTGGPRQGTVTIGPRVFTIFQSGAVSSPPFGFVDTPADGAVVAGSVAISGWALDDLDVTRVLVFRDPVAGEPAQPIFVGQATFVPGARPDVEVAFPTLPFKNRAGWGYLVLTNMLPNHGNGTFRFSVIAEDSDLTQTLIGTKIINAVNNSATAPFGAIDTPDQGATISGSAFINFGWALTPQPKLIPFDGSTIHVILDGVDVGPVTAYNFFRSDVSNAFPGLKNSGGPVGYRIIDTTALSEGLHTIAWTVTDDGGITTGIGSRFFAVSNSAWQPSLRANFAAAPPAFRASEVAQADATTAVPPRVDGVDLGRQAASLAALPVDADGARTVRMSSLQVLQLSLAPRAGTEVPAYTGGASCPGSYAGYLVVNGALRALPVGSSLDPAGTFYWHPGPAFFGTYHLLFVRTSCDGTQQRIPLSVLIQ